jgi:flagellar hook-length control protein FliK
MIVTGGPQTSLSSVQPLDQGSAAAAPQSGADFAALLFLMIGTSQASNNPVAAESAETVDPLSHAASPQVVAEVSAAGDEANAGQASEVTEAAPHLSFEPPSPTLEGFSEALADQTTPALSVAGNAMPADTRGLDVDAEPAFDSATLGLQKEDSSRAGSEEKAQTPIGGNKIADVEPIVGSWSPEPAGEQLSSAQQFQAVPATVRTVGRDKASATPERLNEPSDNDSEAAAAGVGVEAATARPVVSTEVSHGDPGASAQTTVPRHFADAENDLGHAVSHQQRAAAADDVSRFNSSGDAHPEKTSGAEWNEPHSAFVLAPSKVSEVAETRPEAPARSHDIPISAFPASQEPSSENHTVSPREWRPVIGRVANEIAGHLRVNQHEAIIQLDPPDLGKIKIDLHVQGDKLQAHIIAEAHESHALIENHLGELRQALQAQSLDVVDVRVSHGGFGDGGDPTAGFRQHSHTGEESGWRSTHSPDPASEGPDARRPDRTQRPSGRVSVWA